MMKKLKVVAMVIYVVMLVMVAIYMFMGLEAFSRYLELKSVLDIWPQAEDVLIRCICVFLGVTAVVCFIRMLVIDWDRQRLYDKVDYAGILAAEEDDDAEYEEVVLPDEEAYEEARKSEDKRSVIIKKDKKKEKDCFTRADKAVKKYRARLLPWPEDMKKKDALVSNPEMKNPEKKPAPAKPVVLKVEKVEKPATVPATTTDTEAAKKKYIQSFTGYADLFE